MRKSKKLIIGILSAALMLTSISAYAATFTNSQSFSNVILPETSGNTTLATASSNKTTSLSYGQAKISSYTNCSRVSCWFRSFTSDGATHYWTPYIVTISDTVYHTLYYSDSSSSFYAAGVGADLRAENADEALNIYTDKVSGTVYFN